MNNAIQFCKDVLNDHGQPFQNVTKGDIYFIFSLRNTSIDYFSSLRFTTFKTTNSD